MAMGRLCANNIKKASNLQAEDEFKNLDDMKLEGTFMLSLGRYDGIGKLPTIKDNGVLSSNGVQAFKGDLGVKL